MSPSFPSLWPSHEISDRSQKVRRAGGGRPSLTQTDPTLLEDLQRLLEPATLGDPTRVYIATGTREALVVPEDAVYRRFGVSYVKLQDGTEAVVQVGLPVEGGIEILAGLHEGDVVITP